MEISLVTGMRSNFKYINKSINSQLLELYMLHQFHITLPYIYAIHFTELEYIHQVLKIN